MYGYASFAPRNPERTSASRTFEVSVISVLYLHGSRLKKRRYASPERKKSLIFFKTLVEVSGKHPEIIIPKQHSGRNQYKQVVHKKRNHKYTKRRKRQKPAELIDAVSVIHEISETHDASVIKIVIRIGSCIIMYRIFNKNAIKAL